MWERTIIIGTSLVEISKNNAISYIVVFFGNIDDVGKPLKIFNY